MTPTPSTLFRALFPFACAYLLSYLLRAVNAVFSFKPADIITTLKLLRPIYSKTTNYGHFGKTDDVESLTWERTDKATALRRAANAQ